MQLTRSLALATVLLAAALSPPATMSLETDETVEINFNDVYWAVVIRAFEKIYRVDRVEGDVPNCRVTMHNEPLPARQFERILNQRYGISISDSANTRTLFIPTDTSRMCDASAQLQVSRPGVSR